MKTIPSYRLHAREAVYLKFLYRSLLILLITLCASFTAKADADSTIIKLSVIDNENSEAIPFANVVAYQNGMKVAVATTDMDGKCAFKNLVPGKYDFKAVYVGYQAQEIKRVDVFSEKTNWLNIKLKTGIQYITCCCVCYCYERRTDNWWPKLWTPYREAYTVWKEKKNAKPKEIKLSEEPDETEPIDSSAIARVQFIEPIKEQLKIYPNPASDVLHIESAQPLQTITLLNQEGKIVKEELMQSNVANINLNGFPSGVYYLNYVVNEKNETKKVVIVN